MAARKKRSIVCTFCGKDSSEVSKIVAGPGVFICDECIDLAAEIVSEGGGVELLIRTRKALGVDRKNELDLRALGFTPQFKTLKFEPREKHCFYLSPFSEPFNTIYRDHVRPSIRRAGFTVERADEIFGTQPIIEDIWEGINGSQAVLADVTGRNPNVMYEIGMAHTVGRPVVIITQNMDDVPFDLKHRRCIMYAFTPRGCDELEQKIEGTLRFLVGDDR